MSCIHRLIFSSENSHVAHIKCSIDVLEFQDADGNVLTVQDPVAS